MCSFTSTRTPPVLLLRAALKSLISQAVSLLEAASIRVQHLPIGLTKPHEGPPLKPVQVSLNGISSLLHFNHNFQLCVISSLAGGALNSTMPVSDKDVTKDVYKRKAHLVVIQGRKRVHSLLFYRDQKTSAYFIAPVVYCLYTNPYHYLYR